MEARKRPHALDAGLSCPHPARRRQTTTDGPCRVGAACAHPCLDQGAWGVCQTRFPEEALENPEAREDDPRCAQGRGAGRCPCAAPAPHRGAGVAPGDDASASLQARVSRDLDGSATPRRPSQHGVMALRPRAWTCLGAPTKESRDAFPLWLVVPRLPGLANPR